MPSANKNKRKGESLNSPLPPKKQEFKTVMSKSKKVKFKRQDESSEFSPSANNETSPIALRNEFDLIADNDSHPIDESSSPGSTIQAKKQRVPPVVVYISNFSGFRQEILHFLQGIKVSFQIARRGDCRVLTESLADRERLMQYLSEKQHKFYTFDDKSERMFKVVLKGLPGQDKTLEEIKNEINDLLGFAPAQVIKMKMKSRPGLQRGIPYEYFLVHFNKSNLNNLKQLEKAKIMFHVHVTWEHFKRPGGNFQNPTQCRKCQEWGHGTKHCYLDAKCMNCGDSSHTKDVCPVKEEANKFKCANCGGNHKSNFWQCPSRKKVIESRTRQMKKNVNRSSDSSGRVHTSNNGHVPNISSNIHTQSQVNGIDTNGGIDHQTNGSTYASVVAGRNVILPTNVPMGLRNDAPASGSMTASDFNFLSEQLQNMINAMFKANTMLEAVQLGVKFTTDIVIGLRFSNGSK